MGWVFGEIKAIYYLVNICSTGSLFIFLNQSRPGSAGCTNKLFVQNLQQGLASLVGSWSIISAVGRGFDSRVSRAHTGGASTSLGAFSADVNIVRVHYDFGALFSFDETLKGTPLRVTPFAFLLIQMAKKEGRLDLNDIKMP